MNGLFEALEREDNLMQKERNLFDFVRITLATEKSKRGTRKKIDMCIDRENGQWCWRKSWASMISSLM